MRKLTTNKGFTLVELTFGIAFFSFILIALTVALVSLFHTYQKGIAVRATQRNARVITDAMSREASNAQKIVTATGPNRICFLKDRNNPGAGVVYVQNGTAIGRADLTNVNQNDCPNPGSAQTLSSTDVSVRLFNPTATSYDRLATYQLSVAANSNLDDLDGSGHCQGGVGSQFCSATEIDGTVMARKEASP